MANLNLAAVRGDTETYELALTNGAGALDLTDADITFTVKRRLDDDDLDAVIQKTVGDGITITGATEGEATLVIDPVDTADLPSHAVRLYYDLQVTVDGQTKTPLQGRLTVRPDVTTTVDES